VLLAYVRIFRDAQNIFLLLLLNTFNRPFDYMVYILRLSKRINIGGFRLSLRCEVLALLECYTA
jgi:hypothetical protein